MSGFQNALGAEWLKLSGLKKYRVLFVLLMIAYAAGRGIAYLAGYEPGTGIVMGGFLFNVYLPLIAFLGVNDLFASEIRSRSIQQCLLRPVTRMSIYLAKCTAVLLKCALQAAVLIGVDCFMGLASLRAGSCAQAIYAAFDLVPLFSVIAFSALISVCVPGGAFSMLLTVVLYIGLHAAGTFLSISPALFVSYLSWHGMLHGGMTVYGVVMRVLCVTAPAALFLCLGMLCIERMRF